MTLDGLPVIDADESETITVAVSPDDIQAGDMKNPKTHPIAIAVRRRRGVDDERVSKGEVLIRRGDVWFRYNRNSCKTVPAVKKPAPSLSNDAG